MADEPHGAPAPIDVAALMADLRQRVARKRTRGLYVTDVLARSLAAERSDPGGPGAELLERLQGGAVVRQQLLVGASTRPGVGPVIERAKRAVVRAGFNNLADVTAQQNGFNADAARAITALASQVARLEEALGESRRDDAARRASAQDAAATVAAASGGVALRLVADAAAREALIATPGGPSQAIAVLSAAIPDGPEALEQLAGALAAATAPGGRVAIAPGARDAVSLAALLRASGFTSAGVRPAGDGDEQPGGHPNAHIVLAER